MRWIDHVEQMLHINPTKFVLKIKIFTAKGIGDVLVKKRFLEGVERDNRKLGARKWREVARDRRKWKTLLK